MSNFFLSFFSEIHCTFKTLLNSLVFYSQNEPFVECGTYGHWRRSFRTGISHWRSGSVWGCLCLTGFEYIEWHSWMWIECSSMIYRYGTRVTWPTINLGWVAAAILSRTIRRWRHLRHEFLTSLDVGLRSVVSCYEPVFQSGPGDTWNTPKRSGAEDIASETFVSVVPKQNVANCHAGPDVAG